MFSKIFPMHGRARYFSHSNAAKVFGVHVTPPWRGHGTAHFLLGDIFSEIIYSRNIRLPGAISIAIFSQHNLMIEHAGCCVLDFNIFLFE